MQGTTTCSIIRISNDAMGIIASLLSGHSIAKLWLTGNKRFQCILTTHGVAPKFLIEIWVKSRFKWPHLLSQFPHLEELKIVQNFKDPDCRMRTMPLHRLPKSLTSLHLEFSHPEYAFGIGKSQS